MENSYIYILYKFHIHTPSHVASTIQVFSRHKRLEKISPRLVSRKDLHVSARHCLVSNGKQLLMYYFFGTESVSDGRLVMLVNLSHLSSQVTLWSVN